MLQGTLFPPDSSWRPPRLANLPQDWNVSERVSIDTETCDQQLRVLGCGARRGAYIVGLCFALTKDKGWYLPTRHHGGDNMEDPEQALAYFRDQAAKFEGEVVGAKLDYDLDMLAEAGITFPKAKTFKDVQVAEPLLDELQYTYGLDAILERHGLPPKDETLFKEAITAFGLDKKNPKKDLWKLPARYVGLYGERDVTGPLELMDLQEAEIEKQQLGRVWKLEQSVTPILVKMRRKGVLIDLAQLDKVERFSIAEESKAWGQLQRETGVSVKLGDAMKAEVIAHALRAAGIPVFNTAQGKPSITKEYLEGLDSPVGKIVRRARQMSQLRSTFVSSIRKHSINKPFTDEHRIHCTFNQIKREDDSGSEGGSQSEGAAYGRLSCKDPNLQQQPARDPEIGPMWRAIYIPAKGKVWGQLDYSQQEPRGALHFAIASGAARIGEAAHKAALEAQRRYIEDPSMDSHTMFTAMVHGDHVLDWAEAARNGDRDAAKALKKLRDPAKNIFLGIVYGMGGPKLCRSVGLPTKIIEHSKSGRRIEVAGDEGQALIDLVNRRVPYLKKTAEAIEKVARERGYVVTAGGRRCRFPKDDNDNYDWTFKAYNRVVQGSAADQTKQAMVDLDAAGFELQLQVHDEFDLELEDEAEGLRAARIMEQSLVYLVPSKVDVGIGPSWGEVVE